MADSCAGRSRRLGGIFALSIGAIAIGCGGPPIPPGPPSPLAVTTISPNFGLTSGASTVTLRGTGFEAGAIVTIGAAAAQVSFSNSTSLTAVTAAHAAGPVDVVVTNPGGESARLPLAFAYEDLVIKEVVPNIGSTSGNGIIRITGSGFQSGAVVMLDGVTATIFELGDHTSRAVIAPPHSAGEVDVVVRGPKGDLARLISGYRYVSGGALDIDGDWTGDVEGFPPIPKIQFTVRNNTVTSLSCGGSAALALVPAAPIIDGRFAYTWPDSTSVDGEFLSPIESFGNINTAACKQTIWYGAKR